MDSFYSKKSKTMFELEAEIYRSNGTSTTDEKILVYDKEFSSITNVCGKATFEFKEKVNFLKIEYVEDRWVYTLEPLPERDMAFIGTR